MNQKEPTSNTKGVCEKLFNAFSVNPTFRSCRLISRHPQIRRPAAPTLPLPPAALDCNASSLGVQKKQNTNGKTERRMRLGHINGAHNNPSTQGKTGTGLGQTHQPGKNKVGEAVVSTKTELPVPVPLPTTKTETEKLATAPVPTREKVKTQVFKVCSKIEPATPSNVSVMEEGKPNPEVSLASPPVAVSEKVGPPIKSPTRMVVAEKAEDTKKTRSNSINTKASDYITRAKAKFRTTTIAGGRFSSFK